MQNERFTIGRKFTSFRRLPLNWIIDELETEQVSRQCIKIWNRLDQIVTQVEILQLLQMAQILYRSELVLGEREELKVHIGAEGGGDDLADAVPGEHNVLHTDELF